MTITEKIKQEALRLGFDACGIAAATATGEGERYKQWLSEHCHGTMEYMARNVEKRIDPRLLVEGAQSIISVGLNYYPPVKLPGRVPQFAYYAYGKDYHDVMRSKLRQLFEWIKEHLPDVKGRYFSDSAPVLERFWAARSGLGFIGKNTQLIIPNKGSYFFLGELIIDIKLDYDQPIMGGCEGCSRCLKACPAGALEQPYWLNAEKCISYLTIEHRGAIPKEYISKLRNNIFGCDICQKACPYNRDAVPHNTPEFVPSEAFLSLDLDQIEEMDEDQWRTIFRHSAVKRTKFIGLKRNAEAISISRDK